MHRYAAMEPVTEVDLPNSTSESDQEIFRVTVNDQAKGIRRRRRKFDLISSYLSALLNAIANFKVTGFVNFVNPIVTCGTHLVEA